MKLSGSLTFFALPFFGNGMNTDLFQSCGHCWVFQIYRHIECSTLIASSFRIWKSSTGNPSPPLTLFIVMLPKAHLNSHFRMSGSRWVVTPSWLSESWGFVFFFFLDQFTSIAQSCPALCDPMNCSTPGLPVHPSLTPGVHANSCPPSWWCHPAISSPAVPFSSCLQSFPVPSMYYG